MLLQFYLMLVPLLWSTKRHGKSVSVRGPCPGMIVGSAAELNGGRSPLGGPGPLGRPRYSPTNCGQITLRKCAAQALFTQLSMLLLLLRVWGAVDTVHIKMLSHITPVGVGPTPPTCTLAPRPAAGSNTPPPPVHSLAAPVSSPLLSPASTAAGRSQPLDDLVVSLSPLCRLAAAASRRLEDEGHGRVPERPGGRQGRHRPQGLGTLCSLPPARQPAAS